MMRLRTGCIFLVEDVQGSCYYPVHFLILLHKERILTYVFQCDSGTSYHRT